MAASKPHLNKKWIPVALLIVLAGVMAVRWWDAQRDSGAPPSGSGTVEATEVEVAAQIPGRLVELRVREGDRVQKGDVIARLEDTELRAQLQQAMGQRDAALNTLRNLEQGSRSEQIAAARAQLAAAEAAHNGARRSLETAELGYRRVTELRQAVIAAEAQVHTLEQQRAAARRTLEAAGTQAAGAEQTLATAEEGMEAVTELRQQKDAAEGQLETARASRNRASAALETARNDAERIRKLFEDGAVSRRDFENSRLALETAQAAMDTSEAQVATAQATLTNATRALTDRLAARQAVINARTARGTTSRQAEAARAQVRQVEAQLEGAHRSLLNARNAYEDRLQARSQRETATTSVSTTRAQVEAARQNLALLEAGSTKATLDAARGQLETARGAVALAQKRLADAVVRAPGDGTVSTIVTRVGETVSAGLPIVKMLDIQNLYVRIYLPFSYFARVKIGHPADIETDAIPREVFPGTVIETATEAEFTPKNVETRDQRLQQVYWVKVAVSEPDGRLKPGMPARALILEPEAE